MNKIREEMDNMDLFGSLLRSSLVSQEEKEQIKKTYEGFRIAPKNDRLGEVRF